MKISMMLKTKKSKIVFSTALIIIFMLFMASFLIGGEPEEITGRHLFDTFTMGYYPDDKLAEDEFFADCYYSNTAVNKAAVDINMDFLNDFERYEEDTIIINLFSEKSCTVKVEDIVTDINGVKSFAGTVRDKDVEYGYLYLSKDKDVVLMSLDIHDENTSYIISYNSLAGSHYFFEIPLDSMDYPENLPSLTIPPPPETAGHEIKEGEIPDTELPEITANPLEQVNIDLMIVYTPNAASWANSSGGINNIISQAVTRANTSHNNSNTNVSLRLVHSAQVSYTENNNGYGSVKDLERLTNTGDSYMDIVHDWRDEYGADLVALFTFCHDTGGLAWGLMANHLNFPEWSAGYGFSITRVQQAASTYTMVHELGHNMGAGHHKQQSVQAGPQCFSYSAGWRWSSSSRWYNSVMSYSHGSYYSNKITSTPVPYFSNPNVLHLGVPTGHSSNGDNARTIRETKDFINGYRDEVIFVESIILEHETAVLAFSEGHNTISLAAAIHPLNATNQELIWTSDNPSVAEVNQEGEVVALSPGEAIITVTSADGKASVTCLIEVFKI